MFDALQAAARKLLRDREESPRVLLVKSARYARELALAHVYLRAVDRIGKGVRTLAKPRIENLGHMEIGDGTLLRSVNVPVELATGPHGTLHIGRDCRLNYGVSIGAMGGVRLGDRVRVGPYVMIIDTSFHEVYDRSKTPPARPITIEDDVWLGAKASVLPGVTIGRGSIVSIGSVVAADVEPFTVVAGNPARLVKKLDPTLFVVHP